MEIKKEYLIGILTVVVLVPTAIVIYQLVERIATSDYDYQSTIIYGPRTRSDRPTVQDNKRNGTGFFQGESFSFQYPEALSLTEKGDTVFLSHSIPYAHPNLCDFRDGSESLDYLTDFDVSLKIYPTDLKNTLRKNVPSNMVNDYFNGESVRVTPDFIDEYSAGNLKGYRITTGVEGCGVYSYYFSLANGSTLYITRSFVPEFQTINPQYKSYQRIPGIISPKLEETYFQSILSSIRFKF